MDGIGGYGGWRWIFIIEGLMTFAIGLVSKFWVSISFPPLMYPIFLITTP
jgi:hypothetical protein